MKKKTSVESFMRNGAAVDAAMVRAFDCTVAAHRRDGVPMAVQGDDGKLAVVPSEIVETSDEARARIARQG